MCVVFTSTTTPTERHGFGRSRLMGGRELQKCDSWNGRSGNLRLVLRTAGLAWLGMMLSLSPDRGYGQELPSVDILPTEAQDALRKNIPDLAYVVVVHGKERLLLIPQGTTYEILKGEPFTITSAEVSVRTSSTIHYTGSNCHVEVQGGVPVVIPNTQECRDQLRL